MSARTWIVLAAGLLMSAASVTAAVAFGSPLPILIVLPFITFWRYPRREP